MTAHIARCIPPFLYCIPLYMYDYSRYSIGGITLYPTELHAGSVFAVSGVTVYEEETSGGVGRPLTTNGATDVLT